MKKTVLAFLVCATLLVGSASAQTIPHVTATFKTPEGKTPTQAGLKAMATIGATSVYGSVDFQPFDSMGNKPARILCGNITYIPQRVRGWIKGDGTLVDNYTAAAGVDVVPNIGCTPTGLVTRAFITLGPTPDGRVASVTWTEDKQLPQQASVDWGTLAAAGVSAIVYQGYSTIQDKEASQLPRNIVDFTGTGVSCADDQIGARTICNFLGGGRGGPNPGVAFTGQTTVTIPGATHALGTKNLIVHCYDTATPANPVRGVATVHPTSFDVTVQFAVAQSGYCVVNGSGPYFYPLTFASATILTVLGSQHGLASADLQVTIWDSASGTRTRVRPASVTVDSTTFDVTVKFAVPQSGRIVVSQ